MKRILLLATCLPLCCLWMMAVHELGHVVGAWLTGGTVVRVVLHPLTISRTDVQPNPAPQLVAWAGPLLGCLLPLALLAVSRLRTTAVHFLVRFFAGFCLIANGAYLAFGSIQGIGDAGDLLRSGAPAWSLWLFGLLTVPAGLRLWHGLGPSFGFAAADAEVPGWVVSLLLGLLLLTLFLELAFNAAG